MAKMIINGEVCSGSNSYASAVEYIKEDGSKTTVQAELSELNSNIDEQNDKFERRVGNIDGYLGDWSTIDFSRYGGRPSIRFIREDNGDTHEIRFTSTGIEFYTNGALVWSK